jgi:hypothetical protein
MKKYLFAVIIRVLTSTSIFAQTNVYHPFPDSNGIWNFHFVTNNSYGYYSYGIFGDTIIDLLKYKKVYRLALDKHSKDTVITVSNSDFIGGLREDNAKRVYFYNISYYGGNNSINLLYDFSKQVGDTIKFGEPQSGYTYPYLVLENIDSIMVNDKYRKRYNLEGEIWIEGIGSTRDLLSAVTPLPTCFCINEIVCYKYGDTTYYLDPKFHDCYPFLGTNIKAVPKPERVVVSPNPIVSQAFLTTDLILKNAMLTFYSSYGQRIKQIKNISGQAITINKDNLPVGLYFIRLTQGNKLLWTGKIEIANY